MLVGHDDEQVLRRGRHRTPPGPLRERSYKALLYSGLELLLRYHPALLRLIGQVYDGLEKRNETAQHAGTTRTEQSSKTGDTRRTTREEEMVPRWRLVTAIFGLFAAMSTASAALAQKHGGILKQYMTDSPASMSIHEETTVVAERPMMGVFNNLVMFDQHVAQNSLASIVPELATDWSWDEDGVRLTFHLRHGVKWHDGKPFTAADVKCTWDLLQGKTTEKLRVNPRKAWYTNLAEVTTERRLPGDFVLKRPQPAFLALLASGMSPVYPCHVSPAQMRQHPVGTGPFKFVEFKPNEYIKVARNPDYWKPGLPYLDGIEYTISRNRSTAILAFVAGKYDLTFAGTLTIPLTRDLQRQRPDALCELSARQRQHQSDRQSQRAALR